MKKIVIFDLDGTLVNSIADLADAVNYALGELGYPQHELASFNMMIGHGVKNLLLKALPSSVDKDTEVQRVLPLFFDYYNNNIVSKTTWYEGIPELLETLSQKGYKLAVASNKFHAGTTQIVKTLFSTTEFAAVYGQREGVAIKPDPQIIFDILNDCQLSAADAIYVGDSGVDMKTAIAASVTSVGVTWGFRSREELMSDGANHVVDTAFELATLIDEL